MRERSDPERSRRAANSRSRRQERAGTQPDHESGYSYGGFRHDAGPPSHSGYAEQGFGQGEQGNPWGGGARGGYGGGRPGSEYGSGGWSADLREQEQFNPAYGERGEPRLDEARESHWRGGGTWSGYAPRGGARESQRRPDVPGRMGPDPGVGWGNAAERDDAEERVRDRSELRERRTRAWGTGSNRQSASGATAYDRGEPDAPSPPWPYLEPWAVPGPFTGVGPEGYRRPDESILEEVCERLTRHGELDASGISVRVEDNEVILEGSVDSRPAKRLAEDTAASVSGVRDVHNRLRIRDSG